MAKYVLQHIPPPVLVEDGLGDSHKLHYKPAKIGLNPCFSGGWSRRSLNHTGSVTVTES